jgi:hypothetical protein
MKRLALIAAVLAIAGCKTSNTKSDMSDSTAAAAPAMSADTGMKMAADTAAKAADTAMKMKDTAMKKGKKM